VLEAVGRDGVEMQDRAADAGDLRLQQEQRVEVVAARAEVGNGAPHSGQVSDIADASPGRMQIGPLKWTPALNSEFASDVESAI